MEFECKVDLENARVDLVIEVTAHEEDDYSFEVQGLWITMSNIEIPYKNLSDEDKRIIDQAAESLAYESADEAHQSWLENQADFAYDMARDA